MITLKFSHIIAPIEFLMLDPNNPRLSHDLNCDDVFPDTDIEKMQKTLIAKFDKRNIADEDGGFTNIRDLIESICEIGYVPIDKIVLRKISNSDKYVVIEGNRRVSSIKLVLQNFINKEAPFNNIDTRTTFEQKGLVETLKKVPCLVLDVENLSKEEASHCISVVLGLRHHGSLLGWKPLPKAYNVYKEYMHINPPIKSYALDQKKIKQIAHRLSISASKVRVDIETYVAYSQLKKFFLVKPTHFSLIQAGVTNRYLRQDLFNIDNITAALDENSLDKMNTLCQFETRDDISEGQKILKEPKSFEKIGQIYRLKAAQDEVINIFGNQLIKKIFDKEISVEDALEQMKALIERKGWINSAQKLLNQIHKDGEEQNDKKLKLDSYSGTGNDKAMKDALKNPLSNITRIAAA